MNNKGFTLSELLATIVIMTIIIAIAVPSVITISNRAKEKMFCEKISAIESAAKLYGQDNIDQIENGNINKIKVSVLVQSNLLKKDDDNCTLGQNCIKDPRNNSGLDEEDIELSIANSSATYKRVKAEYIGRDAATCNNN